MKVLPKIFSPNPARVFLDGVEMDLVVEADDELGEIELCVTDAAGILKLDQNGQPMWKRMKGKVLIISPMGPPTKELALHDWVRRLS